MNRYIFSAIIVTQLIFSTCSYGRHIIKIGNQEQFNQIQQYILDGIQSKEKSIIINLAPGIYVSKENHIYLHNINALTTKIKIVGKDAIVVPEGNEYRKGDAYRGVFSPDNSWMAKDKDIDIWSDCKYADGLIKVIDKQTKLCRLKISERLSNRANLENTYILIPHWFRSSVYKIDKIHNHFIYFIATDLSGGYHNDYNVNDDYNYKGKNIRYKLCNTLDENIRIVDGLVNIPNDYLIVRESLSHNFLTLSNCHFYSFEIKGVRFWGNSFSDSTALFDFINNDCRSINISQCEFVGLKSVVININATANVNINNLSFASS